MKPQEAIEELKYSIEPNQGFMECRTGTIKEEAIKMAIEAIEKQATKQATSNYISEWIPVSERTPVDPDESVLITVNGTYKNITFEDAIMMAVYDKDEGWIIDGYEYWLTAQVTAWQPLPEPYREEGAE